MYILIYSCETHENNFYVFQQTSLKLAVTPQPRSGNEPIGVSNSQHMAIKIEGVIATATTLKHTLRTVKSLKLTLNSQLQNPAAKVLQTNDKLPDCNQNLEHTVEPHNDFFSTQFLLPFAVPGTHQVSNLGVSPNFRSLWRVA